MKKTAFIFPGQGAQKPGMGLDFYESSETAKKLYKEADEILGFDFSEMCFRGTDEELTKTINTQPAIYVHSVIASRLLEERGIKASASAGHSIGEYAALTAAGVLSFEDGLRLVRERGRLMNDAGIKSPGTMAAVIGMKAEQIKELCLQASEDGYVGVANYNSPEQVVISGTIASVQKASEIIKAAGAKRVVPLKVGAAFHSPLMKEAAEEFAAMIDKASFSKPLFPVVSNYTAKASEDPEVLKEALRKQMLGSVLWTDSVREMSSIGIEAFAEAGPGKALCGMIKKTDISLKTFNAEDMASLEKCAEELKAL